jgi:membrane-associated phospholipid phosphatase
MLLSYISVRLKHLKFFFIVFLTSINFSTSVAQNPDIQFLKHINLNRNQHMDPAMRALSNSSAEICIAVPTVMIAISILKKDSLNFRKSFVIGASMFTSASITYALKHAVNRQRPFIKYSILDPAISASSASFPSGHTSNSFALATSLSLAYPKWYVIVPSYLWASSVAYSRLHLGVHYPSDIAIGAIIGVGSSYLNYKLNKVLGNKKLAQRIF